MRLLLSLLLIISAQALLSLKTKAQSQAPSCPSLNINCPTELQQRGVPVTISLSTTGISSDMNPKYNWKVADGKIISGQGTPEISVDTSESDRITVTVEVEGLPTGCDKVRSCSVELGYIDPPWAMKFDDYGFLSWKKERERLNNLAIQLQQNPGEWKGYVIIYGPSRVEQHLERVRDYLVTKRGIDSNRIVLVNGGHNKKVRSELWTVPTGATPPTPDPNF